MHLNTLLVYRTIFLIGRPGGTPRNSWRGIWPGSLNPDPISNQKCHFPHPLSVAFKIHTGFRPGL